jgi:hypothetical protein
VHPSARRRGRRPDCLAMSTKPAPRPVFHVPSDDGTLPARLALARLLIKRGRFWWAFVCGVAVGSELCMWGRWGSLLACLVALASLARYWVLIRRANRVLNPPHAGDFE